jgi:beta-glucosidase-like glycosyl hydrolase
MATAKHFLANNQEHWRYGLSADLDDRTTMEIYMAPFLRAIEVSDERYNDTVYACDSDVWLRLRPDLTGGRILSYVFIQQSQSNICVP